MITKARLNELKAQLDKINGVTPEPTTDPLSRLNWTPEVAATVAAAAAKSAAKVARNNFRVKADRANLKKRNNI